MRMARADDVAWEWYTPEEKITSNWMKFKAVGKYQHQQVYLSSHFIESSTRKVHVKMSYKSFADKTKIQFADEAQLNSVMAY